MYINKALESEKRIVVNIPLTTTSGKTRVKTRSTVFEYGLPHAGKQKPFSQANYVEWQIGYDAEVADKEKIQLTTLKDINFIAYNGKNKALYELSEYLYYFYKRGMVKKETLLNIIEYLNKIDQDNFIDSHKDCKIYRSQPTTKIINEIEFFKSEVVYPLLVHKFGSYEIIAEIVTKEKQYAIGVQPMLYFCFPITELKTQIPLLGRTAETKEFASFIFDEKNYIIIIEMIKIFGILSEAHRYDILKIIDTILKNN